MSITSTYPSYKTSGEFWLGEIPQEWTCEPLKYVAKLNTEKVLPEEAVRYVGMENVQSDNGYFHHTLEQIPEGLSLEFRETDVLFGKLRPYLAKSWLATFDGVCSSEFLVLSALKVSPRFLNFVTLSREFIEVVDSSTYGAKMPRASWDFIGLLKIPVPGKELSEQIAAFLDYETAKIDALIEKQQQLIALLGEKRQAVISHAVTKGLNPDAPMRDSGVEWLGEVPEHWQVSKFGYISSVVRGGSPRPAGDPTLFHGDYSPWVTVAEVTKDNRMELTETSSYLTKRGSAQSRLFQPGTLLLSNSGATLGVPKVLMIQANANDGVVGFEHLRHNREYCYFYLASLTENLRERIKQGSGQPNLNTDIVKHIEIPIPPVDETGEIVAHIVERLEKLTKLVDRAGDAMELLQERRSALISAAVTGKIDVRGWKPPSSAARLETEMEVA